MGKSCPGALTEGTQHRCGKGAGQITGRLAEAQNSLAGFRDTWECLSQVDACVERFGVNGDEASTCAKDLSLSCCFVIQRTPARGRPVEAVDVCPCRAKAKRRKASAMGKVAGSTDSPISVGIAGVLATARTQSLSVLPREICWAPLFRAVGRREKNQSR